MVKDVVRKGQAAVDPLAAILGSNYPRVAEMLHPHVPAGGLAIDKATMEALFKTLPKQEVDAIAVRASKSSAPEAKIVLEAIKGNR